jgi:signal transduction histidine kinase
MATAPSYSVDGRARVRESEGRLWWWVLGVGLALSAAYVFVPAEHEFLRQVVIYPTVEAGSGIAILVGIRRYRPAAPWSWGLIAAGVLLFAAGDIVWGIYAAQDQFPFPSVADILYLAGYPLIGAGLLLAVLERSSETQRKLAIDAAAITISAAVLMWVYVIVPISDDADLTTAGKIVSITYPCGDLLLLAVAARLILGTTWHALALRLLVGALALTFAADVAYYTSGADQVTALDAMYLASFLCLALAGLHPSMRALTDPALERARPDRRLKLVLIGSLPLIPLAVLGAEALGDEPVYLVVTAGATALLIVLLLLRLDTMLEDARRSAERDVALGRFAADLLAADGRREIVAIANRTLAALVPPGKATVTEPGQAELVGEHAFAAPVRVEGETVAEVVADVGPRELDGVRDRLATVASQLSLALERERLLARERELAQSLLEQNERLTELDEMKNRFVSSASHELRTPLTSMLGFLELVLGGEAGELTDEQREFLEIVSRNADRLNKLVDDVLFLGRADADRWTLEPAEVDLGGLAATTVGSARAAAERRGLKLTCDAEPEIPPLRGDGLRLTQLLDNLVSNAIKFTPSGGTVGVAVARDDDAVRIAVSDSGVGIPADEVPRLFQRFFRATTASAAAPGTGIGLTIVKTIAEAHGGTVAVESEVGVGTTFTVNLPCHPPPDALISQAAERTAT